MPRNVNDKHLRSKGRRHYFVILLITQVAAIAGLIAYFLLDPHDDLWIGLGLIALGVSILVSFWLYRARQGNATIHRRYHPVAALAMLVVVGGGSTVVVLTGDATRIGAWILGLLGIQ